MKPTKFRAWCEGKMILSGCSTVDYKFEFDYKGELKFYTWNYTEHVWNLYTSNVMVCTGLKDKDDVEIYEGDIFSSFKRLNSDVLFKNGAFGYMSFLGSFISFNENENFGWKNNKSSKMKVIGNIYQNKDLLNNIDEASLLIKSD